jgi:hypothetical protein
VHIAPGDIVGGSARSGRSNVLKRKCKPVFGAGVSQKKVVSKNIKRYQQDRVPVREKKMPVVSISPVAIEGVPVAVEVVFSGKDGTRIYQYTGAAAVAILAGANPSRFSGTRIE